MNRPISQWAAKIKEKSNLDFENKWVRNSLFAFNCLYVPWLPLTPTWSLPPGLGLHQQRPHLPSLFAHQPFFLQGSGYDSGSIDNHSPPHTNMPQNNFPSENICWCLLYNRHSIIVTYLFPVFITKAPESLVRHCIQICFKWVSHQSNFESLMLLP